MDDNNRHDKPDRKSHMAFTLHENYRQMRKPGNGKGGLAGGKVHHLAVQCQIVNPENIYSSNILQIGHVILRNIYRLGVGDPFNPSIPEGEAGGSL